MTVTTDKETKGQGDKELSLSPLLPVSLSSSFLLAPIAVVSGAVASSAVVSSSNWLLPLAIAIVTALTWIALWAVIAAVNWSEPLATWRHWTRGTPLKPLPYTQADSDGARLASHLGQFRSWLQDQLIPLYGGALLAGVAAVVVVIVLAATLGTPAILLTVLAICLSQIAVVVCRGNGRPNVVLQSVLAVSLPMMLGYASFKPLSPPMFFASLGFAIVLAGAAEKSAALRNAGYATVLAMVILMHQPIGAFAVAVLWVPQLLLNLDRDGRTWLVAGMLAFAITYA